MRTFNLTDDFILPIALIFENLENTFEKMPSFRPRLVRNLTNWSLIHILQFSAHLLLKRVTLFLVIVCNECNKLWLSQLCHRQIRDLNKEIKQSKESEATFIFNTEVNKPASSNRCRCSPGRSRGPEKMWHTWANAPITVDWILLLYSLTWHQQFFYVRRISRTVLFM